MNEIKKYLDTVCEQIRFQKAHDIVKKELQDHITDQADSFIEQGLEKEIALQKAISEMGDPVLVGTELDRVHRPKCEWRLLLFVVLFFVAESIFRYTLDAYLALDYRQFFRPSYVFSFLEGIAVMFVFYFIDFTVFARHIKKIYAIYILVMAIYFCCTERSAYYFITDFYFFSTALPPFIYAFPVILVGLLYHFRGKSYQSILYCGGCFVLPVLFTLHSDFRMAILPVTMITLLIMTSAIWKGWFAVKKTYALLLLYICVLIACIAVFVAFPDLLQRLSFVWEYSTFQKPFLKDVIQNASLFGSKQNLEMIYNVLLKYNLNYSFCYMLYSAGWIFCIPMIVVYTAFIVYSSHLLKKQKNLFGKAIAKAILLIYVCMIVWNIACNCGLLLSTNPLPLPFFANNTATKSIFFMLLGILLSVFRTGKYDTIQTKSHNFLKWKKGRNTVE